MEEMDVAYAQPSEIVKKIRGNWITRKPNPNAHIVILLFVSFIFVASGFFWLDLFHAKAWMTAIPQKVFQSHQYWRLWTALFAHADLGHLLSNSLLFSIFAYLLYGYFGSLMFPFAALIFGGITNYLVLESLSPQSQLIGISGVVYWMGAAWLTLYLCIETREKLSRRLLKAIGVAMILFLPETFQPEISYRSHFIGFIFGLAWALIFYFWNRQKIKAAEVIELVVEDCFDHAGTK